MHYAMGLGAAILGMVPAVDSSEPLLAVAAAEQDIVVLEGQTTWFNQLHVDFLGTNGEWVEEEIDGDTVVLHPQNDECSFGLHLQWNDQIVYFPMDETSELAFDGTWIKVDQLGRGIVLAADQEDAFYSGVGAAIASECSVQISMSQVASMDMNGDCWQSNLNPGDGCAMSVSCSAMDAGGSCRLRVINANGSSVPGMNFNAECGTPVTVSECQAGTGRSVLCIST